MFYPRHGALMVLLLLSACGSGSDREPAPQLFTIGGTVSGLKGAGLLLRLNSGNDLAVQTNGSFSFPSALESTTNYFVTVATRPSGPTQDCLVSNGAGSVGGSNVTNVSISCATSSFKVGGTISGLGNRQIWFLNNGTDLMTLTGDAGSFSFLEPVPSGGTYSVTISIQPYGPDLPTCTVSSGSGTVTNADVTSVRITCRNLVGKFLYVSNRQSGNISAFRINAATGALTPVTGSPFASGGAQPLAQTVHPNGRLLYVTGIAAAGASGGYLAGFGIDPATGALTPLPNMPIAFAGAAPGALELNSSGDFAVAVTPTNPGNVFVYSLNTTTGALAPLTGSPIATANASLAPFASTGTDFYVGVGGGSAGNSQMNAYRINESQSSVSLWSSVAGPASAATSVTVSGGIYLYAIDTGGNVFAYRISPISGLLGYLGTMQTPATTQTVSGVGPFKWIGAGNLAINVGLQGTTPSPVFVSSYTLSTSGTSGTPIPATGSPTATGGSQMTAFATGPRSQLLHVAHATPPGIAILQRDPSSGAMTPIAGSPFALAAGSRPAGIILDPAGYYVYLVDSGGSVAAYSINSTTGAWTFIASYSVGADPADGRIAGVQ